jgi:hypothetical protein
MKTAVLIAATLLFGPALRSQDLSLVEPGDILVLKFIPLKLGSVLTTVVQVTPEGKITIPSIHGKKPLNLSVQGLSMNEVSETLQQDFASSEESIKLDRRSSYRQVTVERGTVAKLLGQ